MTKHRQPAVFLRAQWRQLAMLNYDVDPQLLQPFVPRGTELDFWQGRAYVSVVGFMFLRTRVLGIPVPFHAAFEEVNLRFYVRRRADEGWRRGVVFIRELVPRRLVAWIARLVYNEQYSYAPMSHEISVGVDGFVTDVCFTWLFRGRSGRIELASCEAPAPMAADSEQAFIAEHYWGYAAQRDGSTLEYRVTHPSWSVGSARSAFLDCNVAELYGQQFVEPLSQVPSSAFVADGSDVAVYRGVPVRA